MVVKQKAKFHVICLLANRTFHSVIGTEKGGGYWSSAGDKPWGPSGQEAIGLGRAAGVGVTGLEA